MTARNALDADVIVVGGGPAGSVTATLLAERGHHVLLLDKAHFPRHKPCSEYVNPAGVRILSDLGLAADLRTLDAHQVAFMAIYAPGGQRFLVDFAATFPGEHALGISATALTPCCSNALVRPASRCERGRTFVISSSPRGRSRV